MVLIGVAWTAVVVWWPQLPLQDDATARGWQSQVAIGLASIVAGLIALLLTVGLAAVQLRASLSWRAMRGIFDIPARVGLLVIVAIGVALPLWVALSPSARWSRWAFVAFGWSLLLAAAMVWIGVERTAPEWLVDRAIRRAVRAACGRSRGNGRRLTERTDVVVELAGHAALGASERRRALAAAAYLLASQTQAAGQAKIDAAISRIASSSIDGSAEPSVTEDTVVVLTVLGVALANQPSAHHAIRTALTGIAQQARANGHHATGSEALDGVVEVAIARLTLLVPTVPCRRSSQTPSSDDVPQAVPNPSGRRSSTAIIGDIAQAAAGERLESLKVGGFVSAAAAATDGQQHTPPNEHMANRLLEATTEDLVGLLASPRPDAGGWPGRWQGPGALADDIRRIGRLARVLYEQRQYTATDTVEQALEDVGVALIMDSGPRAPRPPDRTGWRDAHSPDDADPSTTLGEVFAALVVAAFESGFDRRALLTARRLLAATTMAAASVDIPVSTSLGRSFQRAIRQLTRYQPDNGPAHRVREAMFMEGLIAEIDPLLAACSADGRLEDLAREITGVLVWATNSSPAPLATALWKARLRTAGWLVEAPPRRHLLGSVVVAPLPARLLVQAHDELRSSCAHAHRYPSYAAALISCLWAHAVACMRSGDGPDAAEQLHDLLSRWRDEFKEAIEDEGSPEERVPGRRRLGKPLTRLIGAALHWTEDPHRTPVFPRRVPPFAARLHNALADPRFRDRSYSGLRDGETLVLVEEYDGSTRLLRDSESRARAEFEWGYGGGGPTTLAEVLTTDALGDLVLCPACLGGAAYTSNLVHCRECTETGLAPQLLELQLSIAEKVETLPRDREPAQRPAAVWTWTRREILEHALRNLE
ncbi:hypothetical protein ACWCOV_10075 [Kribbella sp. NPDC002412]